MLYTTGMGKVIPFLILVNLVFLSSCESKNPVEQYGNDVTTAYKGTQQFGARTSIKNLQDAIKAFQAMNGRYPVDLKELEHFIGSPLDGSKYEYDASTGIISARE